MIYYFTERFPEAVVTKCRKCTEKQKVAFDKIANWFNDNDQEKWNQILRKAITDFTIKGNLRREQEAKQAKQ